MERIGVIRNTYLSAYLHALRQNAVDPSPLMGQTGIPEDFEYLTDYMLPASLLHRFIQSAVKNSAPGAISTAAGLYNAAHQPNPFSDTVKGRRSLGDAIDRHNANIAAYSPENQFDLQVDGMVSRWRKLGRSPTMETETFSIANLIGHVRSVLGGEWLPDTVGVAVADTAMLRELPLFSGVAVRKLHRHTCLTFPARLLDAPIGIPDRSQLEGGCVTSSTEDPGFLWTLRTVMKSYARTGDLNVDTIAAVSGTSKRTLQRYLHRLGVSYTGLADQVRFEVASELLATAPELSITQVGLELGYRDPGSFSRAFRRCAGMAPITYRRRFAANPQSVA